MANDSRPYRGRSRRSPNAQGAHSGARYSRSRRSEQNESRNEARRSSRHSAPSGARRGTRETAQESPRYSSQHAANGSSRLSSSARDYSRSSYGSKVSEYSADKYRSRKTGMSRTKKIVIGVIAALVIVLAGAGISAAVWYNNVANNIKGSQSVSNLAAPAANEPYYVLLMGSDSRSGEWDDSKDNAGERSDSIMVARIDEKNKKVSIISVPRDLRVYVEGHGYQKINSVVEYGGYELLIDKLNDILGIKINYYATVYFSGFRELVNTLGGVTVEVPAGTASPEGDMLPVGDAVTLDGDQALILARCRHGIPEDQGVYAMGDYQRTLNQRNLIKAIANKVLEQDITKMPALVESLSKCVETNMSIDRIVSLAQNLKGMDTSTIASSQLPIGSATINGAWEAVMYQDVFELMCKNFVNGDALYNGLGNFDNEYNDDDVKSNYIDGSVYSYTTYTAHVGSPYSSGYTPSTFTQEAIRKTKAGVSH
jgi:LCP family protein required for cell wall assembly